MSQYYRPLENINQEDIVIFNKIGLEESGKFGIQRQCEVTVNGSPMIWTLSKDKHSQLTESGFKQGDTVKITKWREGAKKGYNFVSVGRNPYEQPNNAEKKYNEVFNAPPPVQENYSEKPDKPDWDKIAEGKVRHGVAIAFIELGAKLTNETKADIQEWTDFIINGK